MSRADGPQLLAEARKVAQGEVERHDRRTQAIANLRLFTFLAGVGLTWAVFGAHTVASSWLALPLVVFVAAVIAHERAHRALERARRAEAFHALALRRSRVESLTGATPDGARFLSPHHPFAGDLDLFGRGSLFEQLSTARTTVGEATLARWLLEPVAQEESRRRQAAVKVLAPTLAFREALAVEGEKVRSDLDLAALAAWGAHPMEPLPMGLLLAGALGAVASLAGLVGWGLLGWGALPLAVAGLVAGAIAMAGQRRISASVEALDRAEAGLALVDQLLRVVEQRLPDAPELQRWRHGFGQESGSPLAPSAAIDRLLSWTRLLEAGRNQFVAPFAFLLQFRLFAAAGIARWRVEHGPRLGVWFGLLGEVEALCSLAAHALQQPNDVWPELADAGPLLEGEGLTHPLMARDRCVANDVKLGSCRLLLVSGSNMSGKSTFLRTLGLAAVLARAGAPVPAKRLVVGPFVLGASLRVADSLQEGASRFRAELDRLKAVLDLAGGPAPLLFLLDEILSGTNSHDRQQGAEALVRTLIERGGFGLVTTHDLALARMVEPLGERARNVHFADDVAGDGLVFDYRMRDGVVTRSNAVALMRAIGLPV